MALLRTKRARVRGVPEVILFMNTRVVLPTFRRSRLSTFRMFFRTKQRLIHENASDYKNYHNAEIPSNSGTDITKLYPAISLFQSKYIINVLNKFALISDRTSLQCRHFFTDCYVLSTMTWRLTKGMER